MLLKWFDVNSLSLLSYFFFQEKPLFVYQQGTCSESTQIKCNFGIITALCWTDRSTTGEPWKTQST